MQEASSFKNKLLAPLKQIIDRKNGELETLQTNLRKLSREYDENVGNLERKGMFLLDQNYLLSLTTAPFTFKSIFKVQSLNQEMLLKREEYDKSMAELKKHNEETLDRKQKDHERIVSLFFPSASYLDPFKIFFQFPVD